MNKKIDDFWKDFAATQPTAFSQQKYSAWSFGNTPSMEDSLADLVINGPKRGTSSLKWIYDKFTEEKFPQVGEYVVILNSSKEPICIIKTIKVEEVKFNEVTKDFAFLEGEGDRSLEYWRDVHWKFFSDECESIGRLPTEDMPVICETFSVVYPKSKADR